MAPFEEAGPCPCQSGLLLRDCRCKYRKFVPVEVDTTPPGLVTGISLPKCYAHMDSNCRPPISREHAFTKSILKRWGATSITRTLRSGHTRDIPVRTAGTKVLCQRHNSALSALDNVGDRFVGAMKMQWIHARSNETQDHHFLFSGYDVERWMLKVLCGSVHQQKASRLRPSTVWQVPPAWSAILFQGRQFPPRAGLYVPRTAYGRSPNGVLTAVVTGQEWHTDSGGALVTDGDTTRVLGIAMTIYGHDFVLHMSQPADPQNYWYRTRMYRQRAAGDAGGSSYVHLGWPEAPPTFVGKRAAVETKNPVDDYLA